MKDIAECSNMNLLNYKARKWYNDSIGKQSSGAIHHGLVLVLSISQDLLAFLHGGIVGLFDHLACIVCHVCH
jgi:hypothetical protein